MKFSIYLNRRVFRNATSNQASGTHCMSRDITMSRLKSKSIKILFLGIMKRRFWIQVNLISGAGLGGSDGCASDW